jgi:predicted transcriptional regulator
MIAPHDDVFLYHSRDSHTAIPDWLAFYRGVSAEARTLAHAIIVMSKGAMPPTKPEIAEALGVDVRSVYRWLNELAQSGIMHVRTVGRRNLYIFHAPNSDSGDQMTIRSDDQAISDPGDQMTIRSSDRIVRHDPHDRDQFFALPDAANGDFSENPITDPPVGVGVGQHESESDSPTTNRAPLKTELARYLKRAGMNAAREFDDPALDYATYRAFVEDKRMLGWEWRQIVSTLRDAPLNTGAQPPPLEVESYADQSGSATSSDLPLEAAPESIGDIARRLLPPDASTADWVFVQSRLVRHDSEAGALAALAARKRVAR